MNIAIYIAIIAIIISIIALVIVIVQISSESGDEDTENLSVVSTYQKINAGVMEKTTITQSFTAYCDPGDFATGGGGGTIIDKSMKHNGPSIYESKPIPEINWQAPTEDLQVAIGWNVTFSDPDPGHSFTHVPLHVYVICLDIDGQD